MGPYETPTAPMPTTVTITVSGDDIMLTWVHHSANAGGYEVWWSTDPYFTPGADCSQAATCVLTSGTSFTHTGAAADLGHNYAHIVLGVNDAGWRSAPSNRSAKFGFALVPGTP